MGIEVFLRRKVLTLKLFK